MLLIITFGDGKVTHRFQDDATEPPDPEGTNENGHRSEYSPEFTTCPS